MAGTAEVGVAETYDATVFMLITRTILVGARLVFTIYVVWYGICIRTELHESEGTQAPGNVCPIPFVPMIGFTRSTTLVCAIATVELAARKRQHIDFLRFIMSYQLVRKG